MTWLNAKGEARLKMILRYSQGCLTGYLIAMQDVLVGNSSGGGKKVLREWMEL